MATYNYNPDRGILYAQSYALHDALPQGQQLFYYGQGEDCTNFISQCVWAAYGGWLPGFDAETVAENRRRILQDIRQTGGVWYGSAQNIGSTRWCRVEEFYSYVTGAYGGPSARKVAEGTFDSVPPGLLRPGDVVQLVVTDYVPGRYGHGLYVTRGGQTWDEVLICCHTYDRQNQPMTEFAQAPQTYSRLRVLRFSPGAFAH